MGLMTRTHERVVVLAAQPLTAASAATVNGNDIAVNGYTELTVDFDQASMTGTGTPTVTYKVQKKDANGHYVDLFASTAQSTGSAHVSTTIGVGAETNKGFGDTIRFQVVGGGTSLTGGTYDVSIIGK